MTKSMVRDHSVTYALMSTTAPCLVNTLTDRGTPITPRNLHLDKMTMVKTSAEMIDDYVLRSELIQEARYSTKATGAWMYYRLLSML
jgi:hypothetical protein